MLKDFFFVKKFEIKEPEKHTNSMQMFYIEEDATKSISKLRKLENQTKKSLSNLLMSRKSILCTKTARNLLLKAINANGIPLLSRNLKIQYLRNKLIPYKCLVLWKTKEKVFQDCVN